MKILMNFNFNLVFNVSCHVIGEKWELKIFGDPPEIS